MNDRGQVDAAIDGGAKPRAEASPRAGSPTRDGAMSEPEDADADGGATSSGDGTPILAEPSVGMTFVLAPLAGSLANLASDQADSGLYGTDLGRSTVHRGALRLLFGDTWNDARATAIDPMFDDVQGEISLLDFPDGASVDRYVAENPAPLGQPAWRAAGPPVHYSMRDGRLAPLIPVREGQALGMALGRTPVAVWSDGGDGLFAILNRLAPLACASSEPRCPDGFVCDPGLGGLLGVQQEGVMPCVIGVDAGCSAVPSGGYCQDPTSSVYDSMDASSRRLSVVYSEELGPEDPTQPGRFQTIVRNTNKFINPCARTVRDFDPSRRAGDGNDYTNADGSGANEKVLLWGRPWFSSARGRDARLYLQWFDSPKAGAPLVIEPQYFTGVRDGVPEFSPREIDARPLDLSEPGDDSTVERFDIVGELSISWIAALEKWVMLYGGHYGPLPLLVMQGGGSSEVVPDPEGGISIRFADHPWGPWSPPQHVVRAHTAEDVVVPLPGAPQGILYRPDCEGPDCPPGEPALSADERGTFYSAHLLEPWTLAGDGVVTLYWSVSTWNPYQTVLLKTELFTR